MVFKYVSFIEYSRARNAIRQLCLRCGLIHCSTDEKSSFGGFGFGFELASLCELDNDNSISRQCTNNAYE